IRSLSVSSWEFSSRMPPKPSSINAPTPALAKYGSWNATSVSLLTPRYPMIATTIPATINAKAVATRYRVLIIKVLLSNEQRPAPHVRRAFHEHGIQQRADQSPHEEYEIHGMERPRHVYAGSPVGKARRGLVRHGRLHELPGLRHRRGDHRTDSRWHAAPGRRRRSEAARQRRNESADRGSTRFRV